MSRVEAGLAKDAPLLQSRKMFGELPTVGGKNKPVRFNEQIDLIKELAHEDGFKAGFEAGTAAGLAEGRKAGFQKAMQEVQAERVTEVAQFLADLDAFRLEFEAAADEWCRTAETVVTELSMEVVESILASELEINHQTALGICKEVLAKLTHARQARILINPKDYALFESHRDEIIKQSRELKSVEFIEDNSIGSGVMIETESGTIDATIETRLELIKNEFGQAA
ncbi:MAG: FliH/SctL family protein [Armatimonadota bacterium]